MDVLGLARWQFAITTVYHFVLVPLTIGLAPMVAIMQTAWVFTGKERWLRLTKFFGKLLLINFALGVATGIVQEFQFGMAWSEYSRFVGDVFGAPLAMEALAAFFLESTFLGLWAFGWGRLSKRVHLACIWLLAIGSNLSAYFILAANSWMQHPVGATFNPETGRAEMDSIWTVLTNPMALAAFPHTLTAAWIVAGTFVGGIATWWMVRLVRTRRRELVALARDTYRPAVVLGACVALLGAGGVVVSGDFMGKLLVVQQPAKMAAAEGICATVDGAAFTVAAFGNDCETMARFITVPGVASFMADWNPDSEVAGLANIQADMVTRFGEFDAAGNPIDYTPPLMVTFWSFRLMMGLGLVVALLALWALWATRGWSVSGSRWLSRLAVWAIPLPFLACSFGWIFTEVGRQPWVVHPAAGGIDAVSLLTQRGVSEVVPPGVILASMVGFTLLYAALGVIWYRLIHRYAIEGVPEVHDEFVQLGSDDDATDQPLSFAY